MTTASEHDRQHTELAGTTVKWPAAPLVEIEERTDCADCWETALVNGDVVDFDRLAGADLVLDRVYRGGRQGGTRDDPLCKLLPVGNQGGFRPAGSPTKNSVKLAVLYTTGEEADWPDALNPYTTGTFTYYGDNRAGPGTGGHPQQGNLLLSRMFAWAHGDAAARVNVPPFLLFDKPGTGRDVRFRGFWHRAPTDSAARKISSPYGVRPAECDYRTTRPGSPS